MGVYDQVNLWNQHWGEKGEAIKFLWTSYIILLFPEVFQQNSYDRGL